MDILKNLKIKASRAEELNDPFELAPIIDPSKYTPEHLKKMLCTDSNITILYLKTLIEQPNLPPDVLRPTRFPEWFRSNSAQVVEQSLSLLRDNLEQARVEFAQTFSRHYRLLCFSGTFKNILMWSHYAKDHTGMVIVFDDDIAKFHGGDSTYRIAVDYEMAKQDFWYAVESTEGFQKAVFRVVGRKAEDWRYEDEVRYVVPTFVCKSEGNGGKMMDFFRFPSEAVKEVIVGARFSPDSAKQLLEILSDPKWKHVKRSQARLSRKEFKLEFDEVDLSALATKSSA